MTPEYAQLDTKALEIILGRFLAPLIIVVIGWIVKDVFLDLYKEKNKAVREEQLFRLREFYSPLFFWSGVALFDYGKGKEAEALKALSALLEKGATLLPLKHYFTFIKLVEHLTNQKTSPASMKEIQLARDYVYSEIELLNYVLFRINDDFDLGKDFNLLRPIRTGITIIFEGTLQLLALCLLAGVGYMLYVLLTFSPLSRFSTLLLLGALLVGELKRRSSLDRAVRLKMTGKKK